jgi:predicted nucleotidyltransferase
VRIVKYPLGYDTIRTMDLSAPARAVCPTVDSDVLAVLAGTTRAFTGREIARLAGRSSHRGVLLVLDRLVEHGLVLREEAGPAFLYKLNRDHVAAPAVEIAADMRSEFLRRLEECLESWKIPAQHASLFGSVARGDGDTGSDIDLLLVRPGSVDEEDRTWRSQVHEVADSIWRWTGNRASIAELAIGDVRSLARGERPIVDELKEDGIVLTGSPVSELFEMKS